MSKLNNYAKKGETPLHRVVLNDYADVKAAEQLGLTITIERLQGQDVKICFQSHDKAAAIEMQCRVNNLANSLRMPPGTDPVEEGALVRSDRVSAHGAHQAARQAYTQARGSRKARGR